MKYGFFTLFIIALMNCLAASGQGLHLGIKAGTDLSEVSGYSVQSGLKGGFMAGAFAEVNLIFLGIQPEVLYSQINTQGSNNQSIKLQYLNIPILLTIKLPIPILSLQLGPQFGTLLNKNDNLTTDGKNAIASGDFSMVAGAQLNLLKFKGGIRYVYGFTDINNTGSGSWETRTVQVYIGLRIF
jgi:hypothetical protein